ncbi:MAG TPA: glycoside hydrolase family 38 C-terminal domain-containing protein [Terriglobia bacterium]|nr:glycoside hydrolase family 38 C-terminal domain-containing protein [Terriglobia bacterium]
MARAQSTPATAPDLTSKPTLYVVGYAHLDTEWRWEYPQVIGEYLPKTMRLNFDLFQKYPHYIFNFSGSNRYEMMKEYFPQDYARVKHYVAEGRWFPAGSSVEEGDVNSPSPESIIRQVLYGNDFFRREFGVASAEYMLPDCFGFPADLPSILAAAGVKGFSTQKLTWGSSAPVGGPDSPEKTPVGTPFNVGMWIGPDGRGVIAALNPGDYSGGIDYDLTKAPPPGVRGAVDWPERVDRDGKVSGLYADYHYYGTGDTGGSPSESSVKLLEAILTKGETVLPPPRRNFDEDEEEQAPPAGPEVRVGEGPLDVISSRADQMFLDILKTGKTSGLPTYKGDLELTNHSAGSLTSEQQHKKWNHENEILADDAERASAAAAWLGGLPYPQERLNRAWRLVMGGQFHDIMAGTATPESYHYSWNDDVIAMNQFAGVLTSAVQSIASGLDTATEHLPIVVYNPMNIEREDVVEAQIKLPGGAAPAGVRVRGPDGKDVPAQLESEGGGNYKVVFLAKMPAVGFAVYGAEPASAPGSSSELKVTGSSLENARYRLKLDQNGEVSSIYDKALGRDLLSGPARLAFQTEHPHDWPAWNMDWSDQQKPPRAYVTGPAKITIAENGPVRVALRVERDAEGSHFVQTIRLAAGDAGNRVEFLNHIDWKGEAAALKAVFPLTASNSEATYNWGAGTIQRPNDNEKTFEMASHEWFDLMDRSGDYGVTILSGAKTGSDKPDDGTLRLTLIYTPGLGAGNGRDYADQTTQDWGHHRSLYGLASHAGDWQQGGTDWQAYRLDHPLIAFETAPHPGSLGKSFSFFHLDNNDVRVMGLKKAEHGDDLIVRVVEMRGRPDQRVHIMFAGPIESAHEVDGQEMDLGRATVTGGALATSLGPYQIRTFAVKLGAAPRKLEAPQSQPVALHYDLAAASEDGIKSQGGFDAAGDALPAEMLPNQLYYNGVRFHLEPAWTGKPDAVVARGQTVSLPSGDFNRVYVIAASSEGDQKAAFRVGDASTEVTVENWGGDIGRWDLRTWKQVPRPLPPEPAAKDTSPRAQRIRRFLAYAKVHGPEMEPVYTGLQPGFIKRAPVAWFASHHHTPDGGNMPYSYAYLFAYPLDLPSGATTLTLPDNDKIRVLAVTVAHETPEVDPAQPLYDLVDRSHVDMSRWNTPGTGGSGK